MTDTTQQRIERMKPCPNCGEDHVLEFEHQDNQLRVVCHCGVSGPWEHDFDAAENKWNALTEEEAKDAVLPVIDLTAMHVIGRSVKYPREWQCGTPRWSAIGAIFGLGSTSSQKLCRPCGENPNDIKLRNGRIKLAQPLPEAPKQD